MDSLKIQSLAIYCNDFTLQDLNGIVAVYAIQL